MPKVTRIFRFASPQQQAVFDDMTSPAILACGAWGSGKTEVALQKHLAMACLDPGNVPLLAGWLRPTAQRLFKLFVEGEGRNPAVCPPDWIVGEPNKSDMTVKVRVPGGWTVPFQFSGLKPGESDISRIHGTQFSTVTIEEATQIMDGALIEELETRSGRVPGAKFYQFLLLCNANAPGHWIHQRFYEHKGAKPGDRLIELPTIPEALGILPPSYYRRLESLMGMLALRYRENKWVGFEGLVYPYDPRKQLLRREGDHYVDGNGMVVCTMAQLQLWPSVQAADPGTDHPWAHQFWRVAPEGVLGPRSVWFLQREIYKSQGVPSDIIARAKRISHQLGVPRVVAYDPAAAWAAMEYGKGGYQCVEAANSRLGGQAVVHELFPRPTDATAQTMTQCRIYFCDDSLDEEDQALKYAKRPTRTTDEFGTYVWATGTREDMCKEKDDGMDAMRYAVASVNVPTVQTARAGEVLDSTPDETLTHWLPAGSEA